MQAWLTSVHTIVETCASSLCEEPAQVEIGITLDRVDRELMRFRNHAAYVRGPLKQHSPSLADRVARATDQVYSLRNHTCAYLLRWQAWNQTDPAAAHALSVHSAMEEARFRATNAIRDLQNDLQRLSVDLDDLISAWIGEG